MFVVSSCLLRAKRAERELVVIFDRQLSLLIILLMVDLLTCANQSWKGILLCQDQSYLQRFMRFNISDTM